MSTGVKTRQEDVAEATGNHSRSNTSRVRFVILPILFSCAAVVEAVTLTSLTSLSGSDIWWHLRTGLWMLQNHELPHHGIYSQSAELTWVAASWAYEVVLALGYKVLGVSVVPAVAMCCKGMLAAITFLLAGGLRGRFWPAVVLSALSQYILASVPPTPVFCSVLLFGATLALLYNSRRPANARFLFWLPLVFFVWANVSPQFVYGVGLVFLFIVVRFIEERGRISEVQTETLAGGLTLVASLVSPYLHQPWQVFFHDVTSSANAYFPDRIAMKFHQPQDYLLLLLTMTAFLALGLRRSRDIFQIATLIGCAALSFHSQGDAWMVALASVAVLGESLRATDEHEEVGPQTWTLTPLVIAALLVLVGFAIAVPHRRDSLLAKLSQTYPVAAANYIGEHRLSQPLFNPYEWGGFLMWYQPELPVAIDGRTNLYPDDTYITYSKALNAELPYTSYPALNQARTVLLPRHLPVAEALSSVPAFKVLYQDDVATVLAPAGMEQ